MFLPGLHLPSALKKETPKHQTKPQNMRQNETETVSQSKIEIQEALAKPDGISP
jgi:hypothetical protein